MLAIVDQNNIFLPTHSFTIPVDPKFVSFLRLENEVVVYFKKPVMVGDIGLRCTINSVLSNTLHLKGICRMRAKEHLEHDFGTIDVADLLDIYEKNLINEGLIQGVKALVRILLPGSNNIIQTKNPGHFADMLATSIDLDHAEKARLLNTPDSIARIKLLFGYLNRLNPRTQKSIVAKANNPFAEDIKELEEKIGRIPLSDDIRSVLNKELGRLKHMHQFSPEYSLSRNYIDFVLEMPWGIYAPDHLNIEKAQAVLDQDHFNLKEVKERILEFLAVKKLNPESKGSILCFSGPPGVGKTSLGKSIALAMGRAYIRISLGGIRDEAEIRGHRRTYIGAMPGRIIKEIQRSKTLNPVFVLDEIDKVGKDFRGDPASALLEVLDPEQNFSFKDNYLEIPFDISHVMFISTANTIETIPPTLLDRMEVIEIPGYSDEEKFNIARIHLLPKKSQAAGLPVNKPKFQDDAIKLLISDFTMESGVRNLERKLEALYRKLAKKQAAGEKLPKKITAKVVKEYLGPPPRHKEQAMEHDMVGIATGLAWTSTGGEILLIETTSMPGSGKLELTGNMGTIMQESARIALGYIKSNANCLNIDLVDFSKIDIHIHVPAGAISKDGPSAGLAMLAALVSHFQGRALRHDTAITGEVTLTGRVLPVGGIKEKILAAQRANISRVLLPAKNEPEVLKLSRDTEHNIQILYADSFLDVFSHVFRESYDSVSPLPA